MPVTLDFATIISHADYCKCLLTCLLASTLGLQQSVLTTEARVIPSEYKVRSCHSTQNPLKLAVSLNVKTSPHAGIQGPAGPLTSPPPSHANPATGWTYSHLRAWDGSSPGDLVASAPHPPQHLAQTAPAW